LQFRNANACARQWSGHFDQVCEAVGYDELEGQCILEYVRANATNVGQERRTLEEINVSLATPDAKAAIEILKKAKALIVKK
jgi:hypothetical protein